MNNKFGLKKCGHGWRSDRYPDGGFLRGDLIAIEQTHDDHPEFDYEQVLDFLKWRCVGESNGISRLVQVFCELEAK